MRIIKLLLLTLSLLLIAACSSSKNMAIKTIFPFNYQGEEYTITSFLLPDEDGVNMLAYYKGDSLIFRARDNDMDGNMDYIMAGSADLVEVNHIYQFGIQEAIRQDRFRELKTLRKYEFIANGNHFTVQTYGFLEDEVYNEFTIADSMGRTIAIWLDLKADGELTDIKWGDFDPNKAQQFYTLVLESGMEADRITEANHKLIVKRN